jgi:hypothetical protein
MDACGAFAHALQSKVSGSSFVRKSRVDAHAVILDAQREIVCVAKIDL